MLLQLKTLKFKQITVAIRPFKELKIEKLKYKSCCAKTQTWFKKYNSNARNQVVQEIKFKEPKK
jgi:hypothetical protein